MKNGFTLIELLAVIVVLAIIALIAVPVVLNIINDSKESSLLRSAEFYLSAVDYTIANAFLYHGGLSNGEYPITPEGNICKKALPCDDANTLKVEVNGDKPTGGSITIDSGNISNVELILDDREIEKNLDGELVYKLAPGLYDENDNLVASWEELVEKYNFETLVEEGGYLSDPEYGVAAKVIDENYSNATKLVIADSVTTIGEYSFCLCPNLTTVIIQNGVKSIERNAFESCPKLKSIVIPKSVTSFGNCIFLDSTNLSTINYAGTESEWNSISKPDDDDDPWNAGMSSNLTINYNYNKKS